MTLLFTLAEEILNFYDAILIIMHFIIHELFLRKKETHQLVAKKRTERTREREKQTHCSWS